MRPLFILSTRRKTMRIKLRFLFQGVSGILAANKLIKSLLHKNYYFELGKLL
jgi:hypothetical protein